MSAPLIPNLFAVCKVLTGAIIWIVQQILYALAGPVPPLKGLGDWIGSDFIITILTWFIVVTVVVLWVSVINLFTIMWVERKLYSRLQDRYGIMISVWSLPFWPFNRTHRPTHKGMGYLQNLADGVKLIQKENITPRNADSAMFHISPVLIASSTLMVFAVLPWSSGFYVANLDLGILFILAAFSLAPLGILIAGWSANNKYTLVGGLRAAAMLLSYSIPMVLAVIALVVFTGSLNPITIVQQQDRPIVLLGTTLPIPAWYVFGPQVIGFLVFTVAMIAEMERVPFDIPEAEAELVEGWTTEYSGMRFGIVFAFKWLRMLAASALISILYLGGWSGPVFTTLSVGGIGVPIVPEEVWFVLRIYLLFLSEFVFLIQILVYAGAVPVLFVFGIMLTRRKIMDEATAERGP